MNKSRDNSYNFRKKEKKKLGYSERQISFQLLRPTHKTLLASPQCIFHILIGSYDNKRDSIPNVAG